MRGNHAPLRAALPLDRLTVPEHRAEGRLKVTGNAKYAADLMVPGMLWAAFRRSDVPHARIRSVDTTAARSIAGVHCALTASDTGNARFGRRLLDQPVLAGDRVRFIGERVAAVAAETREAAEEAAQAIRVEYDDLPAIFEIDEALATGAPILHEDQSTYVYLDGTRPAVPHANIQGRVLVGAEPAKIEAAFSAATHVFEHTFWTPRQHQCYIEPHASLVWIADGGKVHVASTNKSPFSLRIQLAATLGLPVDSIDVDSGFIGGDFGGKGYSPDEFACYYLARATRRPVKAVMSYADELAAANPRHPARLELRTGVDAEGRFVAHQARVTFNGGAYAAAKPLAGLVLSGAAHTMAAYRIPHVSIENVTVYTNTVPCGHMRAPGEVQAVFAGESHVDAIARELGYDPLEFRLLNAIREGERGPTGELHRQPRAVELLQALRRETEWGRPLPPGRGRGVAIGVRHVGVGKTAVRLTFDSDGRITVTTGLADQGAGAYTVLQRVVAATLSVAEQRVRVCRESTSSAPYDAGVGSSRTTHIASRAAQLGAERLKEQIEAAASRVLGESEERVQLADDFLVGELGTNRVGLTEAAAALLHRGGVIAADGAYEAGPGHEDEAGDYNFCAFVAEAEVDPETGQLVVLGVTLAADVGTIINPISHQGQLDGGFAFGIGAALMEELLLDGGRVTTLNLGDYKIPTTMDVPPLRTLLVPTERGPGAFGAKMVGELSNAAVAPAIANAVADAAGIRLFALPLSAERIHAAILGRRSTSTVPASPPDRDPDDTVKGDPDAKDT